MRGGDSARGKVLRVGSGARERWCAGEVACVGGGGAQGGVEEKIEKC